MNWYVVDKGYVEYLKEFDDKVGDVDYGDDAIQEMEDVLKEKAEKLYKKCEEKPDSKLAQRCCNYKLLEEKSKEYKQNK